MVSPCEPTSMLIVDAIEDVATEHGLTNREREVFRMLLAGATDSDVCERLLIARTTATYHAKNILRKTGASRRMELFARVIKAVRQRGQPSSGG
jgi:DNA-binding CsgD family transcriptional regulator